MEEYERSQNIPQHSFAPSQIYKILTMKILKNE
jgi:hypothetical protein